MRDTSTSCYDLTYGLSNVDGATKLLKVCDQLNTFCISIYIGVAVRLHNLRAVSCWFKSQ